jgi:hypothetical protein
MRLLFLGAVLLVMVMAALGLARDDYDYHQDRRQDLALERAEISTDLHAQWAPFRAALWNLTLAGAALGSLGLGLGLVWQRLQRPALQQPNTDGTLPLLLHDPRYFDAAVLALTGRHGTDLERAAHSGAVPVHYAPHIHAHTPHGQAVSASASAPASTPLPLPGVTDLATVGHRPTVQAILLGLGPGGQPVTVPMQRLWHIGLAGATGTGKSNVARLLLPQLLSLNARVSIGDPKFTTYDAESDEDWQPFVDRLHLAPAATAAAIADLLRWHIDELDRRLELRRTGEKVGSPLFLYLDEWHVIEEDIKDAEAMVSRLSRIGRGIGIFLLTAAHSMLMKDGAKFRDQFRTGYYLGGARSTGSALLDLPQREIDESRFDTGIAYLRSSATSPAQIVRVPYASNDAIRGLLTDTQPTMDRQSVTESVSNQSSHSHSGADDYPAPQRQIVTTPEQARVVSLFLGGMDASAVVTELTGMTSKAGKPYMVKLAEVQATIREAMKQGVQR